MNDRTYRVIQWATGNIGGRALRNVIEHPRCELAGLYVSSSEKAGRDAGELAGLAPCGIIATSSADEIIATPADCVLYMRQGIDWDEICGVLASGKNIVTTRGEFHYPAMMDAANRARVEVACRAGCTSIYSTGSSPGFITEALSIPLLSLSRRLDLLTVNEFADVSSRDSPDMIFRIMGFGEKDAAFDQRRALHLKGDFGNSLAQIADAIGLPFDEIDAIGENAMTNRDVQIAAGTVPKGTVGAMRITVTGKHKGRAVARFRANWFVTDDVDVPKDGTDPWEFRGSGWRVLVQGDTPVNVDIAFPVTPEEYPLFTPGLTAHRAVNAVPMVCAAKPGIRTTVDLPQVIPIFAR